MRIAATLIFFALARLTPAQEKEPAAIELTPITVSGSFELRLARPAADPAVQAAERAIAARAAQEEERKQAGVFAAKFWDYLPFTLGASETKDFFLPSYSTVANRKGELQLRASEKNALTGP